MRIFLLTAASALALSAVTVGTASHAQTSESASEAREDINARLSAFFEQYDEQELAHSPLSKAYRGIRDDDYGKWDDPSEAAAIEQYERGQAALAENEKRSLTRTS